MHSGDSLQKLLLKKRIAEKKEITYPKNLQIIPAQSPVQIIQIIFYNM